jgi:iron-sulfur cluster insertion protein
MSTVTETVEQEADPALLVFTDAAASKVKELLDEEDNDALKLRVFVSGGGCSGFQYGFAFDENIEDGDTQIENQGVTLLVDAMSALYLMGAEIDFSDDIEGAQFVIRNPNATTTCGCGNSFAV